MKLSAIAAATVIGASLVSTNPAEAFWGSKVAQQRKSILGTWDCVYETGGKTYRADMNQFSFRRDGGLRIDLHTGNIVSKTMGTWKIDKESELTIPRGGEITTSNIETGASKTEVVPGNWFNTIVSLSDSRLIFEREGGGEEYRCRK